MIKRSGPQKQRPYELWWMIWFDEKVYLATLASPHVFGGFSWIKPPFFEGLFYLNITQKSFEYWILGLRISELKTFSKTFHQLSDGVDKLVKLLTVLQIFIFTFSHGDASIATFFFLSHIKWNSCPYSHYISLIFMSHLYILS